MLETPNGRGSVKLVLVNCKKLNPISNSGKSTYNSYRQYEIKLIRLHIGHTRLTCGYLRPRNAQKLTCNNATCKNQRLTVDLKSASNGRIAKESIISKAI